MPSLEPTYARTGQMRLNFNGNYGLLAHLSSWKVRILMRIGRLRDANVIRWAAR